MWQINSSVLRLTTLVISTQISVCHHLTLSLSLPVCNVLHLSLFSLSHYQFLALSVPSYVVLPPASLLSLFSLRWSYKDLNISRLLRIHSQYSRCCVYYSVFHGHNKILEEAPSEKKDAIWLKDFREGPSLPCCYRPIVRQNISGARVCGWAKVMARKLRKTGRSVHNQMDPWKAKHPVIYIFQWGLLSYSIWVHQWITLLTKLASSLDYVIIFQLLNTLAWQHDY